MGYSHSIKYKQWMLDFSKWEEIRAKFRRIIQHESYQKGFLVNVKDDVIAVDVMKYRIASPMIAFNQADKQAENCVLRLTHVQMDDHEQFSHCKTYGKPYEAYVMALFALASIVAPHQIDVYSDAEPEDWQKGLDLITNVTGKAYRALPRDDEGVIRFEEV